MSTVTGVDNIGDFATLDAAIRDDIKRTPLPGSWSKAGQLYIPNRGWLKVFRGDCVAVDGRGWPILLSRDTMSNGPWALSPGGQFDERQFGPGYDIGVTLPT